MPVLETGDVGVLVKLKETRTDDVLVDAKQSKENVPEVVHIKFPDSLLEMAVTSGSKGEEEKVGNALSMMSMEDPTLKFRFNPEIKEMILSGVGVIQLEVVKARMKNRFGIGVDLKPPKVPYKETVKGRSEGQGKFKRQTGGRGQYGDCWLKIGPLERGKGFEFVDEVFGGAIPKNFIPSIEKGVVGTMEKGVISGHPVVDCKVTVYDGSYHDVDSSDMAFKLAGSLAFQKVFALAKPIILEPIMDLEVTTPDEFVGAVMGDLNSRRGRVMGIDRSKKRQIVKAQVPLSEVLTYAPDLRSLTKGAGKYKIAFSHYEELPANLAKNLMDAYQKTKAPEE
jgi:elongation factor G